MPIYKPSELRQFLESLGIKPKKVLSQNFLIDGNVIRKIIKVAKVEPTDVVLEIGSGPGSLTEELLKTGASVLAVEKDRMLANALERLKASNGNLQIFCEDILEFSIETKLASHLADGKKAKVIANLPYHVTTPILIHLLKFHQLFSTMTLMVQEEVARRFTAKPNTNDYSSITVFLNFYANPRYAFQVSKNCFYPKPSVESAIVIFDLKEPPKVSNQEKYFEMTRTAFNHRRKMLRASLKEIYPGEKISESLEKIGQNPQARPEELSLEDFLALFENLNDRKEGAT